jgi:hypothetical protein
VHLPPTQQQNHLKYPDLLGVSTRILQLPLTLGGLSLRLPASIADIAYAASAADCLPALRSAALKLCIPFDYAFVPALLSVRARLQLQLPAVDAAFWQDIENPEDRQDKDAINDEPLQHRLTKMLNAAELLSISHTLKPWPRYFQAFKARTDKDQKHVSWALNPKSRAFHRIQMLSDAQFSRTIALATLYPIMAPRICACGHPIDPAGFHLLHCHFNHYGSLHDAVKHAVAYTLRSCMTSAAAAISVQVEQPMNSHFALKDPLAGEGTVLKADLIVSLHDDLQQTPIVCDFVSCFFQDYGDWRMSLDKPVRFKRKKYDKYLCPPESFYPLSFGRTNAFSPEITRFCSHVASYFPKSARVQQKLLANISRAAYAGCAQLHSLALRRLQLSATRSRAVASVPFAVLLNPYRSDPYLSFDTPVRPFRDSREFINGRSALAARRAVILVCPQPETQSEDV